MKPANDNSNENAPRDETRRAAARLSAEREQLQALREYQVLYEGLEESDPSEMGS